MFRDLASPATAAASKNASIAPKKGCFLEPACLSKINGQLDGFPLSVDRCGKAVELGFRPLGAALPVPEHEFNPPNPNP